MAADAASDMPRKLACTAIAAGGCSPEGICVGAPLLNQKPVIFDLERMRFRSIQGRGKITQTFRDPASGETTLILSAAPASADFPVAADWKSAAYQGKRYECRPRW